MPEGYLVLVLHAHLPYVLSHGKWPHGSDWLCEAACETYIPLLNLLGALSRKKPSHFTIDITPVLCEMLASGLFRSELKAFIREKIRASAVDRALFEDRGQEDQAFLAARWQDFYESRLADFTDVYGEDLLAAF
jgi:1,4-alpha-glucan branching enzyme